MNYTHLVGSDVINDVMYLEASDEIGDMRIYIQYSDNEDMALKTYGNDVPLIEIEYAISEAKKRLSKNGVE